MSEHDGAWFALTAIRSGLVGALALPAYHPSNWRQGRTSASLALAQRYAILTPQQRAVHDAFAASEDCPSETYDVLPAQTRAAVDEARRKRAYRTNTPVVEWDGAPEVIA